MTQHPAANLAHLRDLLEAALLEADNCDQVVAAHVAMAIARLDELKLPRQSRQR